jgi:acetylornithine deacetylase/succinyl-diaminopimelate desuccinylase-like protein
VPGWDELLERLAETPRENGTAALHETAAWLEGILREGGLHVERVAFQAHPYGLRLAGVVVLLGVLLYARLAFVGRWRAALVTAVVASGAVLAQLDYQVPIFSWIGAETQHHVLARVGPEQPEQRLIVAAHYDTKTDVLDHVQRAPVDLLAVPVVPLMILGALGGALAGRFARAGRWLTRFGRFAAVAGVIYGLATFVVLSAGAFVPARSPGALDDGASCAVMVRMAEALAKDPPEHVQVELLWLSAEEVGVQGSWAYAAQRFAEAPDVPTWVVNLEGLGAGAEHQVIRRETFTLRSYPPAPELVSRLEEVHQEELGIPLEPTWYGGATDARAFLAHGVPAATVVSHAPGTEVTRHLHSAADSRDRLDMDALEASVTFLTAFVRDVDRTPLPQGLRSRP